MEARGEGSAGFKSASSWIMVSKWRWFCRTSCLVLLVCVALLFYAERLPSALMTLLEGQGQSDAYADDRTNWNINMTKIGQRRDVRLETLDATLIKFNEWYKKAGSSSAKVSDVARRQWTFSDDVTEAAIEDMTVQLPPLLKDFRNPCWLELLPANMSYRTSYYLEKDCLGKNDVHRSFTWSLATYFNRIQKGERWRIRCFPYFFLLGVTKSGTTDLYYSMTRYLTEVMSGARKEPHFWSRRRFGVTKSYTCSNEPGHVATFKDYTNLFDEAGEKMILRATHNTNGDHHGMVTGDFTPSTLWSLPQWPKVWGNEGLQEPRYVTAHHLYSLRPATKYIIILRDPVQRAWSHNKYYCTLWDQCTLMADTFHRRVTSIIHSLETCAAVHGYRACVYNNTSPEADSKGENSIIIPGLYETFISDWLKVIPRSQIHIVRFEDYTQDRAAELDKVAHFLEIAPLSDANRKKLKSLQVYNRGFPSVEMLNSTRKVLQQFYAPWNQRLAGLLNDSRFSWDYS